VEADFLREYNVDLIETLPSMTWRKFRVLLRCLSPQSATITRLNADKYIGSRGHAPATVNTPEAAEAAFKAAFEGRSGRRSRDKSKGRAAPIVG